MLRELKFLVMLAVSFLYFGVFYELIYNNGKLLFNFMRNRPHH
ncbi:MAG TPA: hypothetical protein VJI52_03640 [Candidatus Nanoarchaeia archaeon]|nr:hypothetical protein [Candidatus Nanoarchaeia archaeon]